MSRKIALVFVVGAGASKEADLPVGFELKSKIASALNITYPDGYHRTGGDGLIDDAYRLLASKEDERRVDINPWLNAGWRVRDAMPQAISIDNFIDSHRDEPRIVLAAKLAIVSTILAAESTSSLKIDERNIYNKIDFETAEKTWFNGFFQLLTQNCRLEDVPARLAEVVVICFNYDRCIEHFLFNAFQNYYGIDKNRAAELLGHLEIFHPYGSVGPLPWQGRADAMPFGARSSAEKLLVLANGIRTFTEGTTHNDAELARLSRALAIAQKIVFLGFAFHRLNMELLFSKAEKRLVIDMPGVYGTAVGLSEDDVGVISSELSRLVGLDAKQVKLRRDLLCADLFREYWRTLSF